MCCNTLGIGCFIGELWSSQTLGLYVTIWLLCLVRASRNALDPNTCAKRINSSAKVIHLVPWLTIVNEHTMPAMQFSIVLQLQHGSKVICMYVFMACTSIFWVLGMICKAISCLFVFMACAGMSCMQAWFTLLILRIVLGIVRQVTPLAKVKCCFIDMYMYTCICICAHLYQIQININK